MGWAIVKKKPSSPSSPDLIITISGRPGSGKSVVAKRVAAELGFRHASAGDFMRDMAAERGLSILELSREALGDEEIDRDIDARTVRLAEDGDDFVLDARLGWHFIPDSVKVFLDVSLDEAARRIFHAGRGAERENLDLEATRKAIEKRTNSEKERYMTYYGLDYTDRSQFDLVVDTSLLTIDDVVSLILDHVREL